MFTLDNLFLLLTGLLAAFLCWHFFQQYQQTKALHNLYYLMGFAVLLVSGLLLIFLGLGILASPYVLTVASLIPLGISMGLAEQYFPSWKRPTKGLPWLAFWPLQYQASAAWKRSKQSLFRYSTVRRAWSFSWGRFLPGARQKDSGGSASVVC